MKLKSLIMIAIFTTFGLFLGEIASINSATAGELPKVLNFSGYGVGSTQHSLFLALSKGIKKALPEVEPRILASTNTQVSVVEINNGNADYLFTTTAAFINRGLYNYEKLGPQKIRLVWGQFEFANGLMVRKSLGVTSGKDLKGKRFGYYPAAPGWHVPQTAMMKFSGLTWDDVIKVPFPGGMQGARGILDGKADCSIFNPQGSLAKEMESSKYGVYWIPMPAADKDAWDRLTKENYGQYFPLFCDWGAAKEQPFDALGMAYQVLSMDAVSEDIVYATVKALDEGHDEYDKIDIGGLTVGMMSLQSTLNMDRIWCPLHAGVVRYAKEKGLWTPELEKLQKEMLEAEAGYIDASKLAKK